MHSIQSKLSNGLLLSLIIIFTTLWILVSMSVQYVAKEYIASRLEHDIEMLLNTINFDNQGTLIVDEQRIDLIYKQPFSGHYYVINSANQHINSRSLWDFKLKITSIKTGQKTHALQQGPESQSLLLMSGGYIKQGHTLTISIAEDLNPINKNIDLFKYWFAAIAFGMLFILVLLQVFILRKSLKPLSNVQTELKLLQQGKLNKLNTHVPRELQPLTKEVNHLLSIMEQRLHRSRNTLSDLAHAIKKPLTVIKQITNKESISEETKNILIKQTDDISRISDRTLKRARLAGHNHAGTLFSFSDDLPALIKTLEMMHTNKALLLNINVNNNFTCPVEREDMLELLGNLLDNAYKWATHKITLTVKINSKFHLTIEDDGPGTDLEKINELAKRGVRLDEKIQGHGFGLAITTDIVEDYNGEINFKQSEKLGGFRTDIKLPLYQK